MEDRFQTKQLYRKLFLSIVSSLIILFGSSRSLFAAEIHAAAKTGNIEKIKTLLLENPSLLNARDTKGLTPLHAAVAGGKKDTVGFLIGQGADPDVKSSNGLSPVFTALDRSRNDIALLLIQKGADIRQRGYRNRTLLHMAARSGGLEVIRALIEKGCDVNAVDTGGDPPLAFAYKMNHREIVSLLLEKGARPVDTSRIATMRMSPGEAARLDTYPPSPHEYGNGSSALHIPITYQGSNILVPVKINGSRELKMILDTGMPNLMAYINNTDTTKELGLKIKQTVKVNLSLPGIEFPEQHLMVYRTMEDAAFDGVLGADIFASCVVELNHDSSHINLYKPAEFDPQDAGESVPLVFLNKVPYVRAKISITGGKDVPALLCVDVGSGMGLFLFTDSSPDIYTPDKTIPSLLGRGVEGDIYGQIGRIAGLQIGSFSFNQVVCAFKKELGMEARHVKQTVHGNFGNALLRRFNDYDPNDLDSLFTRVGEIVELTIERGAERSRIQIRLRRLI